MGGKMRVQRARPELRQNGGAGPVHPPETAPVGFPQANQVYSARLCWTEPARRAEALQPLAHERALVGRREPDESAVSGPRHDVTTRRPMCQYSSAAVEALHA